MRIRCLALLVVTALCLSCAGQAAAQEKLILYTSLKESIIGKLRADFMQRNPDIILDYQSAGAGKLMAKLAAERESGKILADLISTSEMPDYYSMQKEGMLERYISPATKDKAVLNPFDDFDGYFTATRLGTFAIAYNTRFIKTAPATWQDLLKPEFKGAFGIANPSMSGSAYMCIAQLVKQFGWEYFEKLAQNQARIGKGSGQVVDDTASGDLVASLAGDYMALDKIAKGASINLVYPPEVLVAPGPVAIFKNNPHLAAAKRFVDYFLSVEAQTIIAAEGTLPVRTDVLPPAQYKLPTPAEALKRSIKLNYADMIADKEATVKKFMDILQGKGK